VALAIRKQEAEANKKPRKAYTISASNVLKAANLAATTSKKATEDRISAGKQSDEARRVANEAMKAAQLARQGSTTSTVWLLTVYSYTFASSKDCLPRQSSHSSHSSHRLLKCHPVTR